MAPPPGEPFSTYLGSLYIGILHGLKTAHLLGILLSTILRLVNDLEAIYKV